MILFIDFRVLGEMRIKKTEKQEISEAKKETFRGKPLCLFLFTILVVIRNYFFHNFGNIGHHVIDLAFDQFSKP